MNRAYTIALLVVLGLATMGCDPRAYSCTCETSHPASTSSPTYMGDVCEPGLSEAKLTCDKAAAVLRDEPGSTADCKCVRNEDIKCSPGDVGNCRLQVAKKSAGGTAGAATGCCKKGHKGVFGGYKCDEWVPGGTPGANGMCAKP